MTVALDAVANLGTANTTAGLSQTFTLGGSATALCVLVGGYIASNGISNLTTRTVTCGGTPMVLLGGINCANTAGRGWVELWGLISPATGSQTIAVVENKTTTASTLNVTAISYTGVSQFGTAVTNTGTTATAVTSGAIVSSTGSRVLSVQGAVNSTMSAPSGTSRSDQPASATASTVTLLVQDAAGAATVTNTSTYAGSTGWSSVSVNLVSGSIYQVNAAANWTIARSASASFVGQVYQIHAAANWTMAATATAADQPLGPALRYVGPVDTTSTLTTAAYAQADNASTLVTPTWLTQQITDAASSLVTMDWINGRVSAYLSESAVTTALGNYIADSQLGVDNGVAQVAGGGNIPTGQLPTLVTNDLAQCYDATNDGTVFLVPDTTYTVVTNNINEFVLANVVIPNPGFPWIPLPFAYVLGYSSATASGSRLIGTGNFGYLTVTELGTTSPIFASGLCTDDSLPNFYTVTPSVNPSTVVTPLTQVPMQGGATLQLAACNWEGSQYTFSGDSLYFFVLVVPALGGS